MKNEFWDYETFDYDDSGNRIMYEKQVPGEEFEEVIKNITYYVNTNHVKSDGEWGYVWDLDGNLVMKGKVFDETDMAIDISETEGEVWQYEWDAQNRLVRVKKSDMGTDNLQTITEYTYDHRGYRVKKAVYGDTGTETTYYTFGAGGEVLYKENTETLKYEEFVYVGGYYFAEITGTTDTTETVKYFYITDTLGSVTAMTDEDGRVVWSNEFLAFGIETGNAGFIDAPNIYAGHEYDEAVQLYYARARWYDAEMGRFITEDPIKDGNNWFVYCYNNPLAFVDFFGLEPSYNIVPNQKKMKEIFDETYKGDEEGEKDAYHLFMTNYITEYEDMTEEQQDKFNKLMDDGKILEFEVWAAMDNFGKNNYYLWAAGFDDSAYAEAVERGDYGYNRKKKRYERVNPESDVVEITNEERAYDRQFIKLLEDRYSDKGVIDFLYVASHGGPGGIQFVSNWGWNQGNILNSNEVSGINVFAKEIKLGGCHTGFIDKNVFNIAQAMADQFQAVVTASRVGNYGPKEGWIKNRYRPSIFNKNFRPGYYPAVTGSKGLILTKLFPRSRKAEDWIQFYPQRVDVFRLMALNQ